MSTVVVWVLILTLLNTGHSWVGGEWETEQDCIDEARLLVEQDPEILGMCVDVTKEEGVK